tara:strand:- start:1890 stop:2126 length:237 start_codon:yes stop_codon:yes gene_type:complete
MNNRELLKDAWVSQTFLTSMPERKEIIVDNGYVTIHYSGPEGYSEFSQLKNEDALAYARKTLKEYKYRDYTIIVINTN